MPRRKLFGFRYDGEIDPIKGAKGTYEYLEPSLRCLRPGQTLKMCLSHGEPALKVAKRLKIGIRLEEMIDARGDKGLRVTRLAGGVSEPLVPVGSDDPGPRNVLTTQRLESRRSPDPSRAPIEVRPYLQPGQPEACVVRYKGSHNNGKVNFKATLAGMSLGQSITVRIPSGMDLPRIKNTAANAKIRVRIGEHPAANMVIVTSLGGQRKHKSPGVSNSAPASTPRERCFKNWSVETGSGPVATGPGPAAEKVDIFS